MSTWHVLAIERLGAPLPSWPTIFGPAVPGSDPIAANGLHTLDLTPHLAPLGELATQLDKDLVRGSASSIQLDLADADGSLASALGPAGTLAATDRYYGPWIEVWEHWGTSSTALRFRGYLDESSLQWTEEDALTQATAVHASQLLQERLISDFPELLRPWPSVPTNATQDFLQSTADDLLAPYGHTPRSNKATIEAALWAVGQLSWFASLADWTDIYYDDLGKPHYNSGTYIAPSPSASTVVIGGTAYAVDRVEWDATISGPTAITHDLETWKAARIYLQGAPDLTGVLTLGATVTWGIPEARRTHYLVDGNAIAAPSAGSDGAKSVKLNTVEQLAVGDTLTLTFIDATSGSPRTVTADLPPIIDMDGETGRAYLASALDKGYSDISKVRRNSQDPVLFDGLAFSQTLMAPFGFDITDFVPAPTDIPVLTWLPYDQADPPLYGLCNLQTTASGALRASRRGADNGLGNFPTAGCWSRSSSGVWSWLGKPTEDATHQVFGDVLQFPNGSNDYTAPVIYIDGDLSGGATIPVNGWRQLWRSWSALDRISQDTESTWNGTAIHWTVQTYAGDIPAKLVAFRACSPTPGRYTRTSGGAWTFNAHTGDGTLGVDTTPTVTGTVPTGNWIAMGMGIWGSSGDDKEAILGLVAVGSSSPFASVSAVLLSQASGGNLTVIQTAPLWSTGDTTVGPWALGGGLVVQTYANTIDGLSYPVTVLRLMDGAAVTSATLPTLEVIPQTIQPLTQHQVDGSQKIRGWYALALETYADSNYAPARRLRLLQLDATMRVVNGTPEANPADPLNTSADFSRGEIISSLVPDGALIARMFRLSKTTDEMAGIFGGRLFQVGQQLPLTMDRLKIGATAQARTLTVVGSGDGMTASDYLEKFAGSQLASLVPTDEGGFRLVSRSSGQFRLRTFGANRVSVQDSERGPRVRSEVWAGYIRKVRVSYTDQLTDSTATVEVLSGRDGGRVLELDYSDLLASPPMARALGVAAAYWFGSPVPSVQETWIDTTGGTQAEQGPTWWADWQVGDLVTFTSTPTATPSAVSTWKIMLLQPGPESRSVQVELREMPEPINPGAP